MVPARHATSTSDRDGALRALALSAFSSAAIGMCTVDRAGRFLSANAAYQEMLGYTDDELRGMSFKELTHPDDLGGNVELWEALVRGERDELRIDKRYVRKDGETVWVRLTCSPLAEPGEDLFLAVVEDVTERKRSDELIRDSEARFRAMADSAPVLIWMSDQKGAPSFFNEGWVAFTGRSLDHELASPWEGVHPGDLPAATAVYERAVRERTSYELEYRLRRADGEWRWVLDRATPRFLGDGKFAGHVGVVVDITERQQAAEALVDREERFRTLVANVPGAVYRCALDPAWTMEYLSDAIEEIAGYPAADFIGNRVRTYASVIHPEDRSRVESGIGEALDRNRPFTLEYRLLHADGTERWVYEKGQAVSGPTGEFLWLDGAIFDATERKRAEEGLRRTTSLLRTLIESLQSGILVEDSAGRISFVNQVLCDDFGVRASASALVGTDSHQGAEKVKKLFVDPDGFIERIEKLLSAREPVIGEELELVDGRVLARDYVPLRVGESYTGHLWQFRDITDRKRIEQELATQNEELRALDRMKDEFVALVSHELRTPLTSIIGYLELALEERELEEELRHFLEVADRNAKRLLRLVGDLLFVAQIEAGKLALEQAGTDLAAVAAESVEALRPKAAHRGIELRLEAEPVPQIVGDRARLGQLVDNLISNAVKFTDEGGAVEVRLSADADAVLLEVTDSGIGIPAAEHGRLFERFFRASTATSQQVQGTGLGLTIVKAIVEAHGGRISFESEEGVGTTFRIELPVGATGSGPAAVEPRNLAA